MRAWEGEAVATRFDRATGAALFICVHSTARGPAGGGIRMKSYPALEDALSDGMRLAGAMTLKMAICGAPLGGGKSVIAVDPEMDPALRPKVLDSYAELLGSLKGTYYGAPDMNTNSEDMDYIFDRSPYVFCRTRERGGSGTTTKATALGVFHGIAAASEQVFGTRDLFGRSVVVQGIGGVGGLLAEMLVEAGARVTVSDVAVARVEELRKRLGVTAVAPDKASSTECDVFSPCAVGGILNETTIPELRCAVVAGAANNQLAGPEDDDRLRARGVVYAPDFVINAGGVLHGVGLELWGWSEEQVEVAVERLGLVLADVLRAAASAGAGTQATAERMAREKLSEPSAAEPSVRGLPGA